MEISNPFPLGKRIKEIREQYGYTVNGLSYITGISQSYLRDLELGNKNNPSVEIIYVLCERFDISLKDFFDTDTPIVINKDALWLKINQLNKEQRDTLLAFLNAMK